MKLFSSQEIIGIATHDFVMHADDVASVALINVLTGKRNAVVRVSQSIRTSEGKFVPNPKLVELDESGYILVDIGGGDFDHHTMPKECYANGIPMAACGKVLRASLEAGLVSKFQYDYMLIHGLYNLQAQDNGFDLDDLNHPFGFVSHFNNDNPANTVAQASAFNDAVLVAERIVKKMLADAAKAEKDYPDFLASIGEDKVARLPRYMQHSAMFAMMTNADKTVVEFYTWPSRNGGVMASPAKKAAGKFANLIDFPAVLAGKNQAPAELGLDDFVFEHAGRWLIEAGSMTTVDRIIAMSRTEAQCEPKELFKIVTQGLYEGDQMSHDVVDIVRASEKEVNTLLDNVRRKNKLITCFSPYEHIYTKKAESSLYDFDKFVEDERNRKLCFSVDIDLRTRQTGCISTSDRWNYTEVTTEVGWGRMRVTGPLTWDYSSREEAQAAAESIALLEYNKWKEQNA